MSSGPARSVQVVAVGNSTVLASEVISLPDQSATFTYGAGQATDNVLALINRAVEGVFWLFYAGPCLGGPSFICFGDAWFCTVRLDVTAAPRFCGGVVLRQILKMYRVRTGRRRCSAKEIPAQASLDESFGPCGLGRICGFCGTAEAVLFPLNSAASCAEGENGAVGGWGAENLSIRRNYTNRCMCMQAGQI